MSSIENPSLFICTAQHVRFSDKYFLLMWAFLMHKTHQLSSIRKQASHLNPSYLLKRFFWNSQKHTWRFGFFPVEFSNNICF
jgi:hypothetical protein